MFDFLDIKKLNSFISVSKLVLDFTILHILKTRVIILVKFIQISICDVSCQKLIFFIDIKDKITIFF